MAIAITLQPTEMASWAPHTRHYLAVDGTHLAVESSSESLDDIDIPAVGDAVDEVLKLVVGELLPVHQVVRPTVVFACTDEGLAVDLTPLQTFPPGITHEAALEAMGYEVQ